MRAFLLSCLLLAGLPAQAAYNAMFVFGDSLSDGGNAYALSSAAGAPFAPWPPSPPYAERFTDGPTAAEHLAAQLGIALAPSTSGGSNFAVGGAMTGLGNFNYLTSSPFPLPPSLELTGAQAQVLQFMGSPAASFDPASSLFMLWAAPNDFFFTLATGGNLLAAAETAVTNLVSSIGLLASIGATDFLIPNMPNLASTPLGLGQTDEARQGLDLISTGFNNALASTLAHIRAGSIPGLPGGLRLMEFDTAAFLDEVIGDPGTYGFTNVSDGCIFSAVSNCDEYLFFDGVHPTSAAHRLLGERFHATVPEPAVPALLAIGLLSLLGVRRYTRHA